jgi:hypothetical protein
VKKAVTKAVPAREPRKVPSKIDVAQAVAPETIKVAVKNTKTAYACGFLTSTQQARSIIAQSRTVGEALDKISEFERMMQMELSALIQAELATKRIKLDGRDIRTEASPEGPFIVLTKPVDITQVPQEVLDAAAQAVPATAAKKARAKAAAKPDAPAEAAPVPAKRKYVRRAK